MVSGNKLTFLDVFSGCGGLSLGLFQAGLQGIFAIEKNPDAFLTLQHNLITPKPTRYIFEWPGWLKHEAMMVSDVLANHKSRLRSLSGAIDLVAGGPPCQGFSSAGKRNPDDPRNTLTEEYMEIVSIIQPRFLLIENVRGFNSVFIKAGQKKDGKQEPYAKIVARTLEKLGYRVFSSLICCSDFGIPQYRKRFIIIAVRKNDPVDIFLDGINPLDLLLDCSNDFRKSKGLGPNKISVKEAICDLEIRANELVSYEGPIKGFKKILYQQSKQLTCYQKLMRAGMDGMAPNSLRLARHTEPVIERFKDIQVFASQGKCLTPADREVLGIKKHSITPLHPNLPSATVTTLPDDILHYSEPRILTVRENARLQSFPDWFEFKGKYTTGGKLRKLDCPRYTQVGNAVPPLLAEAIGTLIQELSNQAGLEQNQMNKKTKSASKEKPIILNQENMIDSSRESVECCS